MRLALTKWRWLSALAIAALLSACGYTTEQDVRSFIDAERAALHPVSKAIPSPKPFEAAVYDEAGKPDPFSKQAFVQFLMGAAKAAKPSIASAELLRSKTALEGFALESLAMVGILTKEGQNVALIRAESKIYQVSVGSYIGQNMGKVTKIEEARLTLRELVQDDLGEWSARTNMLNMQERTK
jgi:type IV pilus assembly protein PilP